MHSYQPVRVPARAVALLALWLLACGSTEEYYEPEPYTPPAPYYPPAEPAPEPASNKPAPPSQPTFPAYVAELDRNNVPAVPKTADVTIQYGSPAKPTDDFWQTLSTRYGTAADTNNPNRGNPGDPLVIYDFKLGFGEHQVTLACVAESKVVYESGGSRRLAFDGGGGAEGLLHGGECVLAAAGQVAAVEKIGQRVFVQHAVDSHITIGEREVDAVVAGPAAVDFFPGPFKHAEAPAQSRVIHIRRLDVQRLQQLELNLGGQPGKLRRADFIEDDLDHGPQTRR